MVKVILEMDIPRGQIAKGVRGIHEVISNAPVETHERWFIVDRGKKRELSREMITDLWYNRG
jgi:hypothetical protein